VEFITSLPVGTRVIASKNFGPITKGQLGIVTELAVRRRRFWKRTAYACTFLRGIRVTASSRHIRRHDHACTSEMLEDPLWFLHTCQTPDTVDPYALDVTRSPHCPIG
jgi:FAD/FMN-containing dehydrogenase